MRYRFVINTTAGCVRLESVRVLIDREFAGLPHEVSVDPSAARLEALCDASGEPEGLTIVAVGGDGTVNRVVNTPRPRETAIGIIPMGTANDLAAALGIPNDPTLACRVIREGRTRWIDLVKVNAKRFATCGGIGFAAETAMRANRWRRSKYAFAGRLRWALYPIAAICEIANRRRPGKVEIRCGGERLVAETMTLVVSNQAHFGGRFATSPDASNTDGLFDLCEISSPGSRLRMLWVILRALSGGLGRMGGIVRMRGAVATLSAPRELRFFGDGEILDVARTFEVRLLPSALRVLAPEGGAR